MQWIEVESGVHISENGDVKVDGYISEQNHKIKDKVFTKFTL